MSSLDTKRIEARRDKVTAQRHLAEAKSRQRDAVNTLADARRRLDAAGGSRMGMNRAAGMAFRDVAKPTDGWSHPFRPCHGGRRDVVACTAPFGRNVIDDRPAASGASWTRRCHVRPSSASIVVASDQANCSPIHILGPAPKGR